MSNQMKKKIEERISGIHNGLDLGFSDYFRDQNVRERTISKKLDAIEGAVGLLKVEGEMNFSLFQALGPEHRSPQIYIFDFPSDLRAAFYFVNDGAYSYQHTDECLGCRSSIPDPQRACTGKGVPRGARDGGPTRSGGALWLFHR